MWTADAEPAAVPDDVLAVEQFDHLHPQLRLEPYATLYKRIDCLHRGQVGGLVAAHCASALSEPDRVRHW